MKDVNVYLTYRHNCERYNVEKGEIDHVEYFRVVFLPVWYTDRFSLISDYVRNSCYPEKFWGTIDNARYPNCYDRQLQQFQFPSLALYLMFHYFFMLKQIVGKVSGYITYKILM